MTRKALILLFAVAALIAGSAFAVMAQDDDDNPVPFGPNMMRGHGMMWGDGEPMMFTIAAALGLEPDAFYTALRDGQTLAEIAEAQGVELETVYDAALAHAEEHIAQLIEAGFITQEQADQHRIWMRENLAEMLMLSGSGLGPCMAGQTGFGMGMMGRGRGMRWNNS